MSLAAAAAAIAFRPRTVTASADASDTHTRRRHWKAGEFPFPTTNSSSSHAQRRRPRTTTDSEHPPPPPRRKGEDTEGDRRRPRSTDSERPPPPPRRKGGDTEGNRRRPRSTDSERLPATPRGKGGDAEGDRRRHWKAGEFPATAESQSQSGTKACARSPIKNIQKRLDARAGAKAWACTVTEALSDRIAAKNWQEALRVFEMLKEQTFYHPREGTFMKLILLLGRSGQASRAHHLFTEMQQQGCQPTPELYTALIAGYCRCSLLDEAVQLLADMKALPLCQPDVYTYSTLIKAFVDASRFDLVDAIYREMDERAVAPNTVTQNIVLSGYGRAGRMDDMEKLLAAMLDSATSKPDVWTMNIVLSLFGNSGQVELMEKWYEKFRGYGIDPETRTLNILIGAYGKKRMYDKMSAVMEYMRRLAFPWTTSTFNNVIEAFAAAGDPKNMEHTFNQMRSEGMKPDTKTFCCLINGFSNAALFHKVVGMVKLAERLDVPANTTFHNSVLSACAKAGDLIEMERVYRHMKLMQCAPDATTCTILAEAYRREGMTDKMYDLQQENPSLVVNELVMVRPIC